MITKADHLDSISQYLPSGKMWEAKNIHDSNFRQLLTGLSSELFTSQGYLTDFEQEVFPDETNLFLSEWEKSLGLPDKCLKIADNNNDRRRDIIVKLTKMAVQTADDFVVLAAMYGLIATVQPAIEVISFPVSFPIPLFNSARDARYTIYVNISNAQNDFFTYAFPVVFGNSIQSIVECLFNRVKPTNTQIIFRTF